MKDLFKLPKGIELYSFEENASGELKTKTYEHIYNKFNKWLPSDLSGAVESRKKEYITGRFCAFMAAELLGVELISLDRGPSREPIWPESLVGSISHTDGIALAVVGLKKAHKSVGIDIEGIINSGRFQTIERMVLTDNDKSFLELLDIEPAQLGKIYTIIFSAKEALFKLIYPLCQCYFDFREADIVDLNFEKGIIALEVTSERPQMKDFLATYSGEFSLVNNRAISFFIL